MRLMLFSCLIKSHKGTGSVLTLLWNSDLGTTPGWEHPLASSGRCWTDTTKCSSMEMGCKFPPNTHVDLTGWRTQMCILETRVIASQKYSQSDPAGHLTGAKNGNFGQVLIPISDRSPENSPLLQFLSQDCCCCMAKTISWEQIWWATSHLGQQHPWRSYL